jgi:hypothetical protein
MQRSRAASADHAVPADRCDQSECADTQLTPELHCLRVSQVSGGSPPSSAPDTLPTSCLHSASLQRSTTSKRDLVLSVRSLNPFHRASLKAGDPTSCLSPRFIATRPSPPRCAFTSTPVALPLLARPTWPHLQHSCRCPWPSTFVVAAARRPTVYPYFRFRVIE